MSYVAISERFINDVSHAIRKMGDVESFQQFSGFQPELVNVNPFDPDVKAAIDKAMWREHEPLKDVIPQEWVTAGKRIAWNLPRLGGGVLITGFDPDTTYYAPPRVPSYGYNSALTAGDMPDYVEALPAVAAHLAMRKEYQELAERWRSVNHKVTTFLKGCKSLNEALKLWPDLRLYIPRSYLDKVAEKRKVAKTESRGAKILSVMDVDELVGAVVGARMAGGV